MAPHSSTLAWKIPCSEEPGRLQPMGSQRVGHDWTTSLSFSFLLTWDVHSTDECLSTVGIWIWKPYMFYVNEHFYPLFYTLNCCGVDKSRQFCLISLFVFQFPCGSFIIRSQFYNFWVDLGECYFSLADECSPVSRFKCEPSLTST